MSLESVAWEACALVPVRDRGLEAALRRDLGWLPAGVEYFAPAPWVARSLFKLTHEGAGVAHLDLELCDLVALVVSQDNSCRYCHATQRVLMRLQGVPEARIREISERFLDAAIDPKTRRALETARRISRGSPLGAALERERLREVGWNDDEIRELCLVAVGYVFMNRATTLPALPPERRERVASLWALEWLAPIARRLIRSAIAQGESRPLSAEQRVGPFSELVLTCDGLPGAHALRRTLDEAFDSPLLSVRAKAIVFAVVARGIGCATSEREARRLLRETGLAESELEALLAHLAAPSLEPVECEIARFARETIHYQPAVIQRRARELAALLTPGGFVELIGIAALANAVCRLGALVPRA